MEIQQSSQPKIVQINNLILLHVFTSIQSNMSSLMYKNGELWGVSPKKCVSFVGLYLSSRTVLVAVQLMQVKRCMQWANKSSHKEL